MPSFVITNSAPNADQPIDAFLCGPNANGAPDRRSGVHIRALITGQTITIDHELRPRAIVSTIGVNGKTTYLIVGNPKQLRNRERRIALSKALSQLNQLAATLRPLIAESDDKLASDGLGILFNWLNDERERLSAQ